MSTLLLSHRDVSRSLEMLTVVAELRDALKAAARAPRSTSARTRSGELLALQGEAPGIPAWSVRVQPTAAGARGVLHLFDRESGALLAIMDAPHLNSVASGALGAIAADVLARPDASRVALIGAGADSTMQLKALRLSRSLTHVRIWDPVPQKATLLSARMHTALSLPCRAAPTVAEAVADADLVICAADSDEPLLSPELLSAGIHISSFGSDTPGKQSLSPSLLRNCALFCDDRVLIQARGEVGTAGVDPGSIRAELGEVLAGLSPGRASKDEVTVFSSAGAPVADLAAAWLVYLATRDDDQVRRIDLSE